MTNYPFLPFLCLNYNVFRAPSLSPERGFLKKKSLLSPYWEEFKEE